MLTAISAPEDWDGLQEHIEERMTAAGLPYTRPSDLQRQIFIYEELSGEHVSAKQKKFMETGGQWVSGGRLVDCTPREVQLHFWKDRFLYFTVADDALKSFLIERIQEGL